MTSTLNFTDSHREKIDYVLENDLGVNDLGTRTKIIASIEETGTIRAFGYGSLVDNPHTNDITTKYGAALNGWKKGYVCMDSFFRGTQENPGLTLGLDESNDPEAKTPGAVLETELDPANIDESVNRIIDNIQKLAKRERPPNMPIYTFDLMEVEAANGAKVMAIVCVADKASHMYVGDKLSLEQKAAIIATSVSDERTDGPFPNTAPGKRTDLQYLRTDINNSIKMGNSVDPEQMQLLQLANAYRQSMEISAPDTYAALEGLETDKDLDSQVYAIPTEIPGNFQNNDFLTGSRATLGTAIKPELN